MSGLRVIPAKDRKIRSTLWVPPAERRVPPIVELGLASAGASPASLKRRETIANEDTANEDSPQNASDAGTSICSLKDDDYEDNDSDLLSQVLYDDLDVQPKSQNSAKLDVLRDMMDVLSEEVDVKSEKIKILSEKIDVLSEKEAVLAQKMDILSKMQNAVS